MDKEEKFKLKLSEAKDHLTTLDTSITRTRNKVFYLIGFMLGSSTLFSGEFLKGNYNSLESSIMYIVLGSAIFMIYRSRGELNPKLQGFNGITPDKIDMLDSNKDYGFKELVIHSYQEMINTNVSVLKELSCTYKRIFTALIITGVIVILFCSAWAFFSKCFVC